MADIEALQKELAEVRKQKEDLEKENADLKKEVAKLRNPNRRLTVSNSNGFRKKDSDNNSSSGDNEQRPRTAKSRTRIKRQQMVEVKAKANKKIDSFVESVRDRHSTKDTGSDLSKRSTLSSARRSTNRKTATDIKSITQSLTGAPSKRKTLVKDGLKNSVVAKKEKSDKEDGKDENKEDAPRIARDSTIDNLDGGGYLETFTEDVSIMVTDMAGFTKMTKIYGITHFAGLIVRMRQLAYPVVYKYNPISVETEADDFLVVFPTNVDAVKAAYELLQVVAKYNKTEIRAEHFKINLGGIGIDRGKVVKEHPSGKLYGEAWDAAFLMGEDVADKLEIMVSERVADSLRNHPDFKEAIFTTKEIDELDLPCLCGRAVVISGKIHIDDPVEVAAWDDFRYLEKEAELLVRRNNPKEDLAKIDKEIEVQFGTTKDRFAIMYGIHLEDVTAKFDMLHAANVRTTVMRMLHAIREDHKGFNMEDCLWVFETAEDAVLCAVTCSEAMRKYNATVEEKMRVEPKGFGVHTSGMLIVPGTNVHWGDAVSTASKLGEDLGEDYEVIISDTVAKFVRNLPSFKDIIFTEKHLETSGVQFLAYSLSRSPAE